MSPFLTCYLNLIKAITGTGLIFYPIYLYQLGTATTLLFITISAAVSGMGLYIYCFINKRKGPSSSLRGLADIYTSNFVKYLIDLIVVCKTLLVSIQYLTILRDNICPLFNVKKSFLVMIGVTLLLCPIVCLKRIKSLRFAALIAVCSTFYLILLILFCITFNKDVKKESKIINSGQRWIKKHKNGTSYTYLEFALEHTSFFVFSFTAHHTIAAIQFDFYQKSLKFFITVIVAANLTVALIYGTFAISINNLFDVSPLDTSHSVMELFPDTFAFILAKIGYIALIFFSVPLQLIPCRTHLSELFPLTVLLKRAKEYGEMRVEVMHRYIYSIGILCFVFSVSAIDAELSTYHKLTGATSSSMLCFGLPYILLRKVNDVSVFLKVSSILLVLYGLGIFSLFAWFFIYK